ncbi:MAG: 16S rRNA (cytidine(1402)-2'-O)-methyltransferase [Chloroflexi bacterium]|nr:16S rRNA (cytidine(1402)-2'-O)-methyltransferase [Chloroflexota bacterium]
MGTLYLVATPIGNLDDITRRAVRVLGDVDVIAAEDTRHTGRLLRHLGVSTPLVSYHAHNEQVRRSELLEHLARGDVALVSDAGTPGLSDPGYDLVVAAVAAGHAVSPVPGPSALVAAVTASGLAPGGFTFLGFLPRRASDVATLLADVTALPHPLVIYEAPHRLTTTLTRLLAALGNRRAVAARELTKLHEEIRRAPLADLLEYFTTTRPRGEFVLVIAGAGPPAPPVADAAALMQAALAAGLSPSQAAREVARATGQSRQELYRLAQAQHGARARSAPSVE